MNENLPNTVPDSAGMHAPRACVGGAGYMIVVPKNVTDYKPGMKFDSDTEFDRLRIKATDFRVEFEKRHNNCSCSNPPPPSTSSCAGQADESDSIISLMSKGKHQSCVAVNKSGDCSMHKGGPFCCTTCGHAGSSPSPSPSPSPPPPPPPPPTNSVTSKITLNKEISSIGATLKQRDTI